MYKLTIYKQPVNTGSIITLNDLKGYMIQEEYIYRTLCKVVKILKGFNVSVTKKEIRQDIKKFSHHIGVGKKHFYSITKVN